jgi:GTP-binding protein Era
MPPVITDFKTAFVAVIGRPNSGKSTFVNTLIGEQLCVVTPLPQTTRHTIKGIYTDDSIQLICIDTPGMHRGKHSINKEMLQLSMRLIKEKGADLLVYIVDVFREWGEEEDLVASAARDSKVPVVIVFNKIDTITDVQSKIDSFILRYLFFKDTPHIQVDARSKSARAAFLNVVRPLAPQGPALFDAESLTDENLRFFAAEYLQKGIILSTREEIPHAACVEILTYKENADNHEIDAVIHVETVGQRGIIVGKEGKVLARIKRIARDELRRLTDMPVSYKVHVKVSPRWRDNPRFLENLGYRKK